MLKMGYSIEVSIDARKKSNAMILFTEEQIEYAAYDNDCADYYTYRETEGTNKKITRNSIIVTVEFEKDGIDKCVSFIQKVRKVKGLHLESAYKTHNKVQLLYASKHYLKQLEAIYAEDYKKFQDNFLLNKSDHDYILMKELYKIK